MISMCAIFLSAIAFAGTSQPSQKLLDCNTPIGPDQQVTVIKNGDNMILRELNTSGGSHDRVLTEEEWKSGGLKLAVTRDGTETILWTTPHGWWLESRNEATGYKETAEADCGL